MEVKPEPNYAERVAKDYAAFRASIQPWMDKKIPDNWHDLRISETSRKSERDKYESS